MRILTIMILITAVKRQFTSLKLSLFSGGRIIRETLKNYGLAVVCAPSVP